MRQNWTLRDTEGYFRIEYIIGAFLLVRLIGITNAPLEIAHNWRQVTGLMVARNYFEIDATFWLPRVDETNGLTGIIGMEFPILNYLHYLFSLVFDYQHWYGRLINLVVSSVGIYFFYKLIKERLNRKTAYYATVFLLGSIWFMYSRKMMPDTFSMSLGFIGLFFCQTHLRNSGIMSYTLFCLFMSMAFLSKISALMCIMGVPFLMIGGPFTSAHIRIAAGVVLSLLCTYLWYFQWNPYLSETYGNWYNSGTGLSKGFMELVGNIPETLKRIYFSSFHSYIAFILLVCSTIFIIIKKQYKSLLFLASTSVLFLLYMAKSGSIFYIHGYYIIPIVPVFSIIIGMLINSIKSNKIALALVVLFLIESLSNQQHDLFVKKSETYKLTLESIVSKQSNQNDLIAINGNGNPQELYLSHRKGFVINNQDLRNIEKIDEIKNKGCQLLIINRHAYNQSINYPRVFINDHYAIYDISD